MSEKHDLDATTLGPGTGGEEEDYATPWIFKPAPSPRQGGQLDRFRLERLIGEGGMGQVWEAWDPRLERQVAIKRLRMTNLSARRRFVREARLQATVAHPSICPVFEVGQAEGEPYLVMPRLTGLRLDQAVEGAAVEHKLDLIRQVAEAVHAAHSQGLIHRDLKPANILVESPEDAPPRPVVLDFGIARPLAGDGLTVSGEILGTPLFMAPEQVAGDNNRLDRRTDVYALGATLYCLLAEHPPFPGRGSSLMLRIVRDEPARLQPLGAPTEVEAIVFKCLEKKKEERYDSALALADDLRRYLAGEPVRARPITRWVRLRKWMRRHRFTVRASGLAALLSISALTWGAWTAWRSEERQRLARRFGAQIEEIEALARYSHLVPRHDVRPDQAELRHRLDGIRAGLDDADPVARALAYHALGRGHLALDELDNARRYLETAHELNRENREIKADLGRALSELYRERLTNLERRSDRSGRETLREELSRRLDSSFSKPGEQQKQWQRTLGGPARDLLVQGRSPQARDTLELDALVLFHEGRPKAALDLLAAAPPAPSWAYERHRLEGDIRRSWAVSLNADGAADAEARHQLEAARRAYGQALRTAQSHAALLRDDAQAIALLIRFNLVSPEEVGPLLQEARQNLQNAGVINPEGLRTWLWTVRLELVAADRRIDQARDPIPYLKAALQAGQRALEIDNQASAVWYELGRTHERLARWQYTHGEDPTVHFQTATGAFAQVAPEDRDYAYFTALGMLQMSWAGHEAQRGREAASAYESAVAAYRSASELHSEPFAALSNLGVALFNAARLAGTNPRDMLRQAIETFERAHQLRPDNMVPFFYLGRSRLRLAQEGDVAQVISNDALAERARADFERATELAAERFQPWLGLGELFHLQAVTAYLRGKEPAAFFVRARQAHDRALELAPEQPAALQNLAWTAYFEGKFALRDGLDPTRYFAEAEELCQRSLEARRRSNPLLCLGSIRRLEAEHSLEQGERDVAADRIARAEEHFEEILRLDPSHAEGHRSLGRLLTLEARRLRQMGESPEQAFRHARSSLDRALELQDTLIDFHLADAYWHLEQAEWLRTTERDFTEALAAGRRSLAQTLERLEESREADRLEGRFMELERQPSSGST